MAIFKRTKDKKTGKVTKTFRNPLTGRTRTTVKYISSPLAGEGRPKKKVIVTDAYGKVIKSKQKTKRETGTTRFKQKGTKKVWSGTGSVSKTKKGPFLNAPYRLKDKEPRKGYNAKGGMINRYSHGGVIQHD